ncbi:MAG: hypothetical protein LBI61_02325 [Puniceicoccales bacterium]|jgi:hypothetical protein|nr:hypothetical protein [Puniceicoccales bacterium]
MESMAESENVNCVRDSLLGSGLSECALSATAGLLTQFCGRLVSQAFAELATIYARKIAPISLASRRAENANGAKTSVINMFDLYAKHGREILQLKNDTLRFLKAKQICSFKWLIDSCFFPEFFKGSGACSQANDCSVLRDGIRNIVRNIVNPERVDLVCGRWLSLMGCVGPLAFYGVLKYVFSDLP